MSITSTGSSKASRQAPTKLQLRTDVALGVLVCPFLRSAEVVSSDAAPCLCLVFSPDRKPLFSHSSGRHTAVYGSSSSQLSGNESDKEVQCKYDLDLDSPSSPSSALICQAEGNPFPTPLSLSQTADGALAGSQAACLLLQGTSSELSPQSSTPLHQ